MTDRALLRDPAMSRHPDVLADPDALREEIRLLRGDLGDTLEALAAQASPRGLALRAGTALTAKARSRAVQTANRPGARRALAVVGAAGASLILYRVLRRTPLRRLARPISKLAGRQVRRGARPRRQERAPR